MEIDTIAHYGKMLGLGVKTGVDLPGESEGIVPTREWKKTARDEPWYPGDTISVAIGQGPMIVTPLQVALHTSVIANRGRMVIPYLVDNRGDGTGDLAENLSPSLNNDVQIEKVYFEKVIQGTWLAVNDGGTAAAAYVPGFDVCGKTGSTQTIGREEAERRAEQNIEVKKTHSWFTGFAPKENPRVVVTILIEYGGGGGETAAPLSKKLFERFREIYVR